MVTLRMPFSQTAAAPRSGRGEIQGRALRRNAHVTCPRDARCSRIASSPAPVELADVPCSPRSRTCRSGLHSAAACAAGSCRRPRSSNAAYVNAGCGATGVRTFSSRRLRGAGRFPNQSLSGGCGRPYRARPCHRLISSPPSGRRGVVDEPHGCLRKRPPRCTDGR